MTAKNFTIDNGLTVTGTGGNITGATNIEVTANVVAGNLITLGTGGDIIMTGGNISGATNIEASGNISIGNLSTTGNIIAGQLNGEAGNISNVQVGNITGLGNIATINLDGSTSNVLYGNGVFAPASGGGSYGDSNVASFLAAYGSNTISTTGNVRLGQLSATATDSYDAIQFSDNGTNDNGSIRVDAGSNMVIKVPSNFYVKRGGSDRVAVTDTNSDFMATTNVTIQSNKGGTTNTWSFYANGVLSAPGNITTSGDISATNIGNVAALALDGSSSNVLYGNGTFAPASGGGSYGDSNVVTLLSSFGSNTVSTTGNVTAGNLKTGGNVVFTANTSQILFNTTAYISGNGNTVGRDGSIVLQPYTGAGSSFPGVVIGGAGRLIAPNGSVHQVFNASDVTFQVAVKAVATAATSTTTGGIQAGGGIGVVGNAYIGGSLVRDGAVSAAAWGASGAGLKMPAAQYTDTTSSGTQGTLTTIHGINGPTIAASSATTYTNLVTLYIGNAPALGTNASATNRYSLYVAQGSYFGGSLVRDGAITSTAWTTSGIGLRLPTATYTDNSTAAGTQASSYVHLVDAPALAFSNAVTVTNAATMYVASPTAGTNATITNPWSIVTNGNVQVNGTGAISVPNLPAFRVYGAAATVIVGSNTVNNSTTTTTVDYNQGSAYNNTTGVFTAPVAGIYHAFGTIRVATNNGLNQAAILKNNTLSGANVVAFWEISGNSATGHMALTGDCKLAVGDTLRLQVIAGNCEFDSNDSWGVTFVG